MPPSLLQLRDALSSIERQLARPELAAAIRGDEEAEQARRRLGDRVRRDLLPRLDLGEGAAPALLVGIAGPNNVGKSSLFNALAGAPLSPARAEGGLTKQCLAACHPSLWDERLRAFLTQRYDVVPIERGHAAPVDQPGPPGRLYLVTSDQMPRGLLVLDTPDFDSLYRGNRINAEALLVTVDLVLFVVSRQTYQNAALVDFLRDALGHGRPWAVLYNEATRTEVARAHLDKLAQDVERAPVARFIAQHQPEVEEGRALLTTTPLEGGPVLSALLSAEANVQELKAQALRASLEDAAKEVVVLRDALAEGAVAPERLAARLRHELVAIGSRAALKGVPADVLVDAFRDELDARSTAHRWVRRPFRGLATALGFVGKQVRKALTGPEREERPAQSLTEETLKDGLRQLAEAFAPEVAAWRGDEETARLLRAALGPDLLTRLNEPLQIETPELHAQDRATLYEYSRKLVAQELPEDGRQEVLQALTTLVYSVPASAAAAVTVATGGLGHDAVIWAGTLLSTPLLQRFVDLLGHTVRTRVTKKWAEAHGTSLAKALERTLFADVLQRLDGQVRAAAELRAAFDDAAQRLRGPGDQEPAR